MNKRYTSLLTTLILSVFFAVSASAYDVEVDGICYNLNTEEKTAEITSVLRYDKDITIPQTIAIENTEYKVTSIGSQSFFDCTLISVSIPNSIINIAGYAFSCCANLKSIEIPNSVTSIGNGAFADCSGLTSVTIPNSVTRIEDRTFADCSGLTSVTIPNSVTSIGNGAFADCSGLTSVTIPNSVTNIGDGAFMYCSSLSSITIPSSVTSIGDYAFEGCYHLTSIDIPSSVTSIGQSAFYNCNAMTSITIPNSVISIGGSAFAECSGLTSFTIPNSVISIEPGAFSGCSGLISVNIPISVTSIGGGAFSGCSGLTSVTIPNSVTSIGDGAFSGCSGLTSITIPNSVIRIGNGAFSECKYLTSVTIPNSVTSIEGSAFSKCSGLTSITIPNSVISIGPGAFSGCSGLTSINIPNSVTSIEHDAFKNCTNLNSVTIPNSVTSIGYDAFYGCEISKLYYDCSISPEMGLGNLKELTIGDNVTIVYDYFKRAPLTKIVLGKKVTHIRTEAFIYSNLNEFTVTGEEHPYLYPNVFGSQDLSKAILYIPESNAEYYQTTEPWSKFGKILTISVDTPSESEKCSTPTISFSEGQLQFSCETEGAKCYYTLNNSDVKTGETLAESNNVNLSACYDITCYAKAEGYDNSDVATAKLYWLTSSGTLETANINNVAMRGIAIQSTGGFINISGLDNNEKVDFYGVDGKALGSAQSIDGSVSFSAKQGSVVVAKIGNESVKIAVE